MPSPTIRTGGMGDALAGGYWLEMSKAPMLVIDKPPYAVPTMAEIAAIPWNGLTVASLFAGAGGSSTGYRMAGYRVLWASEFVPAAQDSYRANMRDGMVLDGRDVREVKPGEILAATGLAEGDLDVLDGSPPCQAFSTAGKRERGWGQDKTYEHGAKQKNEELFSEYVRILRGLMPRAFVAENVSGLVKGTAKGMFLEILRELKASGYRVEARLLDAQWLGVPQQRSRVIFVGVRDDLGLAPAFPSPLPYRYSVREAIPWLRRIDMDGHGFMAKRSLDGKAPSPSIAATGMTSFKYEVTVEGANGFDGHAGKGVNEPLATMQATRPVSIDLPPSRRPGGYGVAEVLGDSPSPTVTVASPENDLAVHDGTCRRKFTIEEVMALCSFPPDYVLTGSYAQRWARLGNSVPPLMMKAVAETLRDRVLLPARAAARTAALAACSPARSTNGRSRRGAAPSPPASHRPTATRTRAPAPARTRPAPRGPAAP